MFALFVLLLVAGCGDPSSRGGSEDASRSAPVSSAPQAVSLLGEPLYPLETDPDVRQVLLARVESAEAVVEDRPDDADALIWLGRRLAYAGDYREAIDVFTEGIRQHPEDPRFYRHRGHRFITIRQFDRAIQDLEHAARLVSGRDDRVEPDGQPNAAGVPRSTLQTNIWYHLGLARYLEADYEGAAHAFRTGFTLSPNDDMRVAMADWLWMALMRSGRTDEAEAAIEFVVPEMDILENRAYHRRLLLYRGLLPADSLLREAGWDRRRGRAGDEALQVATYGYGLGTWYQVHGDPLRARARFEDVISTGYWPAFGYIAAEAELARMKDLLPTPPAVDSAG